MCTHCIDLLPHAPLYYAATGDMVKCSYSYIMSLMIKAAVSFCISIKLSVCSLWIDAVAFPGFEGGWC